MSQWKQTWKEWKTAKMPSEEIFRICSNLATKSRQNKGTIFFLQHSRHCDSLVQSFVALLQSKSQKEELLIDFQKTSQFGIYFLTLQKKICVFEVISCNSRFCTFLRKFINQKITFCGNFGTFVRSEWKEMFGKNFRKGSVFKVFVRIHSNQEKVKKAATYLVTICKRGNSSHTLIMVKTNDII